MRCRLWEWCRCLLISLRRNGFRCLSLGIGFAVRFICMRGIPLLCQFETRAPCTLAVPYFRNTGNRAPHAEACVT
jgi:hypothetical protein